MNKKRTLLGSKGNIQIDVLRLSGSNFSKHLGIKIQLF